MSLSWNEIRTRAADLAREWADAAYEKGETQSFCNEFFDNFGVRRRTVARYEEHVQRLDKTSGFIDLFWTGVLLVEQKSAGRDLDAAREQAGTYFDALSERDRPRYQLLSDFQTFELLHRDEGDETRFALSDLPQHVEKFGFILDVQRRTFRDQDPVVRNREDLINSSRAPTTRCCGGRGIVRPTFSACARRRQGPSLCSAALRPESVPRRDRIARSSTLCHIGGRHRADVLGRRGVGHQASRPREHRILAARLGGMRCSTASS